MPKPEREDGSEPGSDWWERAGFHEHGNAGDDAGDDDVDDDVDADGGDSDNDADDGGGDGRRGGDGGGGLLLGSRSGGGISLARVSGGGPSLDRESGGGSLLDRESSGGLSWDRGSGGGSLLDNERQLSTPRPISSSGGDSSGGKASAIVNAEAHTLAIEVQLHEEEGGDEGGWGAGEGELSTGNRYGQTVKEEGLEVHVDTTATPTTPSDTNLEANNSGISGDPKP